MRDVKPKELKFSSGLMMDGKISLEESQVVSNQLRQAAHKIEALERDNRAKDNIIQELISTLKLSKDTLLTVETVGSVIKTVNEIQRILDKYGKSI